MEWVRREIHLPAFPQGIHQITNLVTGALPELDQVKVGLLNIFILHTSASLTINENTDPDVLDDLDRSISALAPETSLINTPTRGPTTCRRTSRRR